MLRLRAQQALCTYVCVRTSPRKDSNWIVKGKWVKGKRYHRLEWKEEIEREKNRSNERAFFGREKTKPN